MTSAALSTWVLAVLLWQSPPEQASARPTYPEAQETAQERRARYQEIADDVAEVVAADVAPGQRRQAAALLLAVAIRESELAKDVDVGPCAPRRVAIGGCDSGRSHSIFQLRGYRPISRRDAARTALRYLRRSANACKHLPREERLAVYAAGVCMSEAGRRLSRDRMKLAAKLEAYRP